jgi:hypothetical protein
MVSVAIVNEASVSVAVANQVSVPSFRKSFSIKEKQEYIQAVDLMVAKNKGGACSMISISQIYYIHSKKSTKRWVL